jgi:hypothetical protein
MNETLHMETETELRTRRKVDEETRRLAEASGDMIEGLISVGSTAHKKTVISSIIKTAQRPGSKPPEVPALQEILRSTAHEQLTLVRCGTDEDALAEAVGFGRWMQLPARLLGEARNEFRELAAAREIAKKRLRRRSEIGLETISEEGTELSPSEQAKLDEYNLEVRRSSSPGIPSRYSSPTTQPFSNPDGTAFGKQQPQSEVRTDGGGGTSTAPSSPQSQRGGQLQRTGRKTTSRGRRERQAAAEKLKKLKSDSDKMAQMLATSTEQHRKRIADASRRRAESHLMNEMDVQYGLGPLAAKHPLFEHSTWAQPQLRQITEGPRLKAFEEPCYLASSATRQPRTSNSLRASRGTSSSLSLTPGVDRFAGARPAARALVGAASGASHTLSTRLDTAFRGAPRSLVQQA